MRIHSTVFKWQKWGSNGKGATAPTLFQDRCHRVVENKVDMPREVPGG